MFDTYKDGVDFEENGKEMRKKSQDEDKEFVFDIEYEEEFCDASINQHCLNFFNNPTFEDFMYISSIFEKELHLINSFVIFEANNLIITFLAMATKILAGELPFNNEWFSNGDNLATFYNYIHIIFEMSSNSLILFAQNNGFSIIFQSISAIDNHKCRKKMFVLLSDIVNLLSKSDEENPEFLMSAEDQYIALMETICSALSPTMFTGFEATHSIENIINESQTADELFSILVFLQNVYSIFDYNVLNKLIISSMWTIVTKSLSGDIINSKEAPELVKGALHYLHKIVKVNLVTYLPTISNFFTLISTKWTDLTPDVSFMITDFYLYLYELQTVEFRLMPLIHDFIPFDVFVPTLNNLAEKIQMVNDAKSKEEKDAAYEQLNQVPHILAQSIDLMEKIIPLISSNPPLLEKIVHSGFIEVLIAFLTLGSFKEKERIIAVLDKYISVLPYLYVKQFMENFCKDDDDFIDLIINLCDEETVVISEHVNSILVHLKLFASDEVKDAIEEGIKLTEELFDNFINE